MVVRESVHNTNKLFHKTLVNVKSFFCKSYQKIPKTSTLSCISSCSRHHRQTEDFRNEWEFDREKEYMRRQNSSVAASEVTLVEDDDHDASLFAKKKKQEDGDIKRGKKLRTPSKTATTTTRIKRKEGYELAKKMKDLDMMDVSDVEHVLDVEEALHYYSRLKSPVYLDIVDNFFMDMYSEFSVPKPSLSVNGSKTRFGSLRF